MNFDINAYMRLNVMDMLLVSISTLIIVFIAKKKFWNKVQAYFEARNQAIQLDLDSAADERKKAEALKQQYEKEMSQAKVKAQELLELAQSNASQERKEILAQTKQEVEQMKEKAKIDVLREKERAKQEMKEAIIDVAFQAASCIVEKELDETEHKKYLDEFIESAGEQSWKV